MLIEIFLLILWNIFSSYQKKQKKCLLLKKLLRLLKTNEECEYVNVNFMKIMLEVDKCQCNCEPGFCEFKNFLLLLKKCFEQKFSFDEKKKFL